MRELERNKEKSHGLAVRYTPPTVATIGHSNRTQDEFLDKLSEHKIQVVIDVRSRPTSRWASQFNRKHLETVLPEHGMEYLFRGHCLGGLDENVGYEQAIGEVVEIAKTSRVVLMCAEAEYTKCHRYTMLTPDIEKHHVTTIHLIWPKNPQKPSKTPQNQHKLGDF